MSNPPQDILGILLRTRDNKLEGEDSSDVVMSDDYIAETCMQFFMDGHSTVANVVKMCCYFLAFNQEIQDRGLGGGDLVERAQQRALL